MTKSLVITFDEKDESSLMSFFTKFRITTFNAPKEAIQARIQQALQSGLWDSFDEEEKEDYVFGAMIMETDKKHTIDTNSFKQEL